MKPITLIALPIALASIACTPHAQLKVDNPLDVDRTGEMVEVPLESVRAKVSGEFAMFDAAGTEIPYQITSDSLLIFQATVPAGGSSTYTVKAGTPSPVIPRVHGRMFPEHKDNMGWENDLAAYTAYGPALQNSGERGYGYDLWTKCVDTLVLESRYAYSIHPDKKQRRSMHKDFGNGMDPYIVASTLGGGTAALLDSIGDIIFPWCWLDQEVTDDGPLRFKVYLTYRPATIEGVENVVEKRVITLDAGSNLNRTEVTYEGLDKPRKVATGIVVHQQNPEGYYIDLDNRFMAYADSTDNPANGNGVIYAGAVMPYPVDSIGFKPIKEPTRDATGHILAVSDYIPGQPYIYYWGSAWSKNPTGPANPEEWNATLKGYADRIAQPMTVTVVE